MKSCTLSLLVLAAACSILPAATNDLLANPQLAADVAQMQQNIDAKGGRYKVKVNPAMQYSLKTLTGLNPELMPASALAHEVGGYANFMVSQAPENLPSKYVGFFSSVKDQGDCGSCWAFATVGAVESASLKSQGAKNGFVADDGSIQNSGTLALSEQQLVSCNPWNFDCDGGFYAFDMLMPANAGSKGYYKGVMPAEAFPYVAQAGACTEPTKAKYTPVSEWGFVSQAQSVAPVDGIKAAILENGSVASCIYADEEMQAYAYGVFTPSEEQGPVNHAVLIVGWNDEFGAWLVKNSWGPAWGLDGYMWIQYGANSVGFAAAWAKV